MATSWALSEREAAHSFFREAFFLLLSYLGSLLPGRMGALENLSNFVDHLHRHQSTNAGEPLLAVVARGLIDDFGKGVLEVGADGSVIMTRSGIVLFDKTGALQVPTGTATSLANVVAALAAEVTRAETAEGLLAPLVSPNLTGVPTAPTAALGTSNMQIASTAFVSQLVNTLTSGAPGTLNTFLETYNRFVNDEGLESSLTTIVGGKLTASNNLSDLASAVTARANLGLGTAATQPASAFDAAGSAAAAQAAAIAASDPVGTAAALVAALTAGSPANLDTFLQTYNRFLADESAASALTTTVAGKQPLNATLSAIAALASTSFGLSVLTVANAAALRTLAGVGTTSVTTVVLKGDGAGNSIPATPGTDYLAPNGSGANLTGITAAQIGAATASQGALAATAVQPNGPGGTVPRNQLPNISGSYWQTVANQAAMLALTAPDPDTLLVVFRADQPGYIWFLNPGLAPATLNNWQNVQEDAAGAAAAVQTALNAEVTARTNAEAGKLTAANNLSDLPSASTARSNLGLGGAATQAVGTAAGTVAAGNDTRFAQTFTTAGLVFRPTTGSTDEAATANQVAGALTGTTATLDLSGANLTLPSVAKLTITPLANTVPTATYSGTAGSYQYVYVVIGNKTDGTHTSSANLASVTNAGNLSGSNTVAISWPDVGATSYDIYRVYNQGTPSAVGKIGSTAAGVVSFTDNNQTADGSTAPSTNTTGPLSAGYVTATAGATIGSATGIAYFASGVMGTANSTQMAAALTGTFTTLSLGTLLPSLNNGFSLGSSSYLWHQLYIYNAVTAAGQTGAKSYSYQRGTVRFAAGSTSLVVTNSLAATTSKAVAYPVGAFDANKPQFTVVCSAGALTIYASTAPAAELEVLFDILIF